MKRALVLWADGCGNEMNVTRVAELRGTDECAAARLWRIYSRKLVSVDQLWIIQWRWRTDSASVTSLLFFRAKYFRGRKLNGEYEIRVEQVSWMNESSSRCSYVSLPESRRAPIASVALHLWTVVLLCFDWVTAAVHNKHTRLRLTLLRQVNGPREPGWWWL